jgi:hypothetical protein
VGWSDVTPAGILSVLVCVVYGCTAAIFYFSSSFPKHISVGVLCLLRKSISTLHLDDISPSHGDLNVSVASRSRSDQHQALRSE